MPVGLISSSKGPDDSVPRQSARDVRILSDILRIVVINEAVLPHRCVCKEGDSDQKGDTPHIVCPAHVFLSAVTCRAAREFQIFADSRQFRFEALGFGKFRDRFGEFSGLEKSGSQRVMSFGVIGIVSQ